MEMNAEGGNEPAEPDDSDNVTLVVENECFNCSKKDLMKASPYFNSMFSCDMSEKNAHVVTLQVT